MAVSPLGTATDATSASDPLLISRNNSQDQDATLPTPYPHKSWSRPSERVQLRIAILCVFINFLQLFSGNIMLAPRLRLLELTICRNHYLSHDPTQIDPHGSVDEELCKIAAIQSAVASLRGWQLGLTALPSLVLCVPLGRYSDKHSGTKKVILLASVAGWFASQVWIHSIFLFHEQIPPDYILASPILLIFGGGMPVFDAMLSSTLTTSIGPEALAISFYWMLASFFAAEIIALPFSNFLLNINIWLPFLVGTASSCLCLLLITSLPDALTATSNHEAGNPARDISLRSFQRQYRPVVLCTVLLVFSVGSVRSILMEIVLQYGARRFSRTIGQMTFLISSMDVCTLILDSTAIPYLLVQAKRHFKPRLTHLNYYASLISIIALMTACLFLGIAPNLPAFILALLVFSIGTGFRESWLPVVLASISQHHVATMCSVVSLVETVGALVYSPLLQSAQAKGFVHGEWSNGLSFYVASALYLLAFTIIIASKPYVVDRGLHVDPA